MIAANFMLIQRKRYSIKVRTVSSVLYSTLLYKVFNVNVQERLQYLLLTGSSYRSSLGCVKVVYGERNGCRQRQAADGVCCKSQCIFRQYD